MPALVQTMWGRVKMIVNIPIEVEPHPIFSRKGSDIYVAVDVQMVQVGGWVGWTRCAVCGCVLMQTLWGRESTWLPASPSGRPTQLSAAGALDTYAAVGLQVLQAGGTVVGCVGSQHQLWVCFRTDNLLAGQNWLRGRCAHEEYWA